VSFIFLSYRPGDDGSYVEFFARELSEMISRVARADSLPPRLYLASEAEIATGDWSVPAAEALRDCTALIAVCSERYVLTERCGREWWSFEDRCRQHEAATGRRAKAIIPMAWGHDGISQQTPASRYTSDVADGGDIRALSRLSSFRERYQETVARIAQCVVDAAHQDPVGRAVALLPYAVTPNAFALDDASGRRSATQGVRFVVVAGRREEMTSIREDVEFYGEERADWEPYRPQATQPLVRHAQMIAAEHLYYSEVGDDIAEIVEVIERAGLDGQLVVLLVDAWAVRLETCRAALAEVDRRGGTTTAVLVPISASDAESVRERPRLGAGISRVLARRSGRCDPMLRIGPDSTDDFDDELGEILESARNLVFRTAPVRRTGPALSSRRRPILEAP
jgi:FxsC-like protein